MAKKPVKCPKCKTGIIYNVNSPFDHRNACVQCGLSHEPGSLPMSLEKQIAGEGWKHPLVGMEINIDSAQKST